MTDEDTPSENEDFGEAELFEAISHETRIHALFALRDGPVGFADLKKGLGISSSGNLQHHIGKLGGLVHTDADGMYTLTDQGREAIIAIHAVRNLEDRRKSILRSMTVIAVFAYYVVQMNIPFVLGTVNPMTPVQAFVSSAAFGIIFYLLWRASLKLNPDQIPTEN
jgi:hypothetical protein